MYVDINNSGTQDTNEPNGSIPAGTMVEIKDANGIIKLAILGADGKYCADVTPGVYIVTVKPPLGYVVTGNNNPTTVTAIIGTTTDAGKDGLYMPAVLIPVVPVMKPIELVRTGGIALFAITPMIAILTAMYIGGKKKE